MEMKRIILLFFLGILLTCCKMINREGQGIRITDQNKDQSISLQPVYSGDSLRNILFPVGGIGTGDILLGGRGNIEEIEIFGKPAIDGERPYMTFFALWFKESTGSNTGDNDSVRPVVKILERRLFDNFPEPWGVSRQQLSGMPRFEEAYFSGRYPFANIEFSDRDVPLKIELEVFNPFIPLDIHNSGLPAAVFHWTITNTMEKPVEVSTMFCMSNPFTTTGKDGQQTCKGSVTEPLQIDEFKGLRFASATKDKRSAQFGDFAIVSLPEAKIQTHGYRGNWWDDAHRLWDSFRDDGEPEEINEKAVNPGDRADVAACWTKKVLKPGESLIVPYILTWYIPIRITEKNMAFGNKEAMNIPITNYYATRFGSAADVADTLISNRKYLYSKTREFTDILFSSSYPAYVIDALSANTVGLKTNLLMMDGQGRVHGFEGLGDDFGCCAGTCTHVWNYAQTMAFLFPELERRVREVSFLHDTHENGYQCFRTTFPPGDYWFKAVAADGQMGNIIRLYREWKFSGDTRWLAKLWPKAKAAMEFAWKGAGKVKPGYEWQENAKIPWDPDKEGVMRGEQSNTYDIDFYGPNMITGSLYLAALKACSEMAAAMNEPDKEKEYMALYEKGRKWYEIELWNGEYFIQKPEVVTGINIPEDLLAPPGENGDVWPKYQYGEGCLSDQLLGQFLAHVSGLGYIIDKEKADQAIKCVYKYNFKPSLSRFENVQRVYGLNDEAGTIACTWPHGHRPDFPFVYADEIWTGIEYQVAASLIYAGYTEEGLEVTKAVRDRYRGFNRNPWAEIESGRFYARAMASWGVLTALSGFTWDGTKGIMTFAPQLSREDFHTFWSCGTAWGSLRIEGNELELKVCYGTLRLEELHLPDTYPYKSIAEIEPSPAALVREEGRIVIIFEQAAEIGENQVLGITFGLK